MVAEVATGPSHGAHSDSMTAALGRAFLIYAATDLTTSLQLWATDGASIHQRLTNHGSGRGAVAFGPLTASGHRTLYASRGLVAGNEPWVFGLLGSGNPFVETYGTGCGTNQSPTPVPQIGHGGGLPAAGNSAFAVTRNNATPSSGAALLFAAALDRIRFGRCSLWLGTLFFIYANTPTSATGTASMPVPIPASIRGSVFFQWGVLTPNGQLFDIATLSGGLRAHIE